MIMDLVKKIVRRIESYLKPVRNDEKVKVNIHTIFNGHFKVTYKGINAIRCPFDYVIYQMIISEVKPDLIIEIGTHAGGSAMYMSDLMTNLGINGEIHTIDINGSASENIKLDTKIKLFSNGWEAYDLDLVKKFKKILVIEDAAHTYECTKGAIEKFASVVSVGSYLIVEDGIVDNLNMSRDFSGGPLKAIREFLPQHPEYIVDRKWCDLFGTNATFNVNGYLKKIS
jgi:cephalosporin hydroxylase